MSNNATLAGHCKVGEHAVLSGFVIVHQFSHIGSYSFIQGGAKINKDIPPFALIAGEPAKFHHINIEKLKRLNFSSEEINKISLFYKRLYLNNKLPLREAALELLKEFDSDKNIKIIVDFILNSERGIIGHFKDTGG